MRNGTVASATQIRTQNKLRGFRTASEFYRLSDRHRPANFLVPTFVDRGVSRGQRGGSLTVINLSFLDRSCYFSFQVSPHLKDFRFLEECRLLGCYAVWIL
jgi:hypothetical protein